MDLRVRRRLVSAVVLLISCVLPAWAQGPSFEVTFPASLHAQPITGRLVLVLSHRESPEPRLTISQLGPPIFGVDVDQLQPGHNAVIDSRALGFPLKMADLPPGDYYAQAILNVYTECRRSDGHTVWVYMNDGLGLHLLNTAPGNLYSEVQKVHFAPNEAATIKLQLSKVIPADPEPADTVWLKHVKIKSELLTKFWGHPVYIGATVLLPKGYDSHPQSYYPAVYVHEHGVPFQFTTEASRQQRELASAKSANVETGYDFYKSWDLDDFPRFIAVTFHQPTPFFPSSYSVNSVNDGPYGDALIQEMIPYLEKSFRIIAQPYARLTEGASTGGWESLALQLYHPDYFGGAWVFNPDPIDFQRWQLIDIYKDDNAFTVPGSPEFHTLERPFQRTTEGQVTFTQRTMSLFEAAMGTHGRSGDQIDGWYAVYGPVGADGYPVLLWDPITGNIDHAVADYMRDHGYDLRAYAAAHWPELGAKITGKLHFFNGDMDNFYLDLAVYRFQDFLKSTQNPHYEAEFSFGRPMKGHNWHQSTWAELLRQMAAYVRKNAPAGADVAAWNY